MLEAQSLLSSVNAKIRHGAGNKPEDNKASGYQAFICTRMISNLFIRAQQSPSIAKFIATDQGNDCFLNSLSLQNLLTLSYRAGGCGEFTAVGALEAFHNIKTKQWNSISVDSIFIWSIMCKNDDLNFFYISGKNRCLISPWDGFQIQITSSGDLMGHIKNLTDKLGGITETPISREITVSEYTANIKSINAFLKYLKGTGFITAQTIRLAFADFERHIRDKDEAANRDNPAYQEMRTFFPFAYESEEFEAMKSRFFQKSGSFEEQAKRMLGVLDLNRLGLDQQQHGMSLIYRRSFFENPSIPEAKAKPKAANRISMKEAGLIARSILAKD